jgi:hypothetical protein
VPCNWTWRKSAASARTIAGMLLPHTALELEDELEACRLSWERSHGPTDVAKYYTSRWPPAEAKRLYELNEQAYFDGLPPFYQEYMKDQMQDAARAGCLDNMPDKFLSLFVRGRMTKRDGPRSP